MSQGVSLTCPQTDDNTHVLSISLHNNGSQDLAAQQGGLEAVGEGIEAPVAQHGYLVMEGAAGERKLWGRSRVRPPEPCQCPLCVSWQKSYLSHPTSSTPDMHSTETKTEA